MLFKLYIKKIKLRRTKPQFLDLMKVGGGGAMKLLGGRDSIL